MTSSSEKEIKKEETQVENQPKESFFQRHKKKIIAGACAVIGIGVGAYIYARNSKKADAPMKDTAESSKEEAQINEQPQRERGDRDRHNNRHGGGNNRQW